MYVVAKAELIMKKESYLIVRPMVSCLVSRKIVTLHVIQREINKAY